MSTRKKSEQEIKDRGPTWVGYFPRKTKTKREKKIQEDKKRKANKWIEDSFS